MRLPLFLPLLLMLAPAAVGAQRLAYENVLDADHRLGPRLNHEPVLDPQVRATYVEADNGDGSVRAFYGDRLEWAPQPRADAFSWDLSAEVGSAHHRLLVAATGDVVSGGGLEYFEAHALYSRPFTGSGLALQAGFRRDFVPQPRRSYFVLGVQGNLTEPFYVGAFGYLSHRGEFTTRLFAYYDFALTERWILQPALETEIAGADVPQLGIGAGPVYGEAGLRLRYRLYEAFAPYVGVNWERLFGRTARMARDEGEEVDSTQLVFGVRSYF